MKDELRKYKKAKCKRKYVEFYIKDNELYKYAESINFQAFVKTALEKELNKYGKINGNF